MTLEEAIAELKRRCLAAGKPQLISSGIEKLKAMYATKSGKIDKDLAYLVGKNRDDYIHDMKIAQAWAMVNRQTIANVILKQMGFNAVESFTTAHNYLGEDNIIRKSAISAKKGEKVLIPLNMRDGSLICVGKGNEDWNNSAPHGTGRAMSRAAAKKAITMEDFKASMEGIYTTSVNEDTIDEACFAYKPSEKIIEQIKDTVDVVKVIKPVYNFKASE